MFKIFKKNKKIKKYVVAICLKNDISTKIGEDSCLWDTYEMAKHSIYSKACGWYWSIRHTEGDSAQLDDGIWLLVEEKEVPIDYYKY